MRKTLYLQVFVLTLIGSLLLPEAASAQALKRRGPFPPADSVVTANDVKVQEGRQRLNACLGQISAQLEAEARADKRGNNPPPSIAKRIVIGAVVTLGGGLLIVYAAPIAAVLGSATSGALVGSGGVISFVGIANLGSGVNELNSRASRFSVCKGVQFKADARGAIQPQ